MATHKVKYRTKDGATDYGFSFEQQHDGNWRVYVDSQPSYRGRVDGPHETHRFSDGSRKFICWDNPIASLAGAKEVAARWADCTQSYISTGVRF